MRANLRTSPMQDGDGLSSRSFVALLLTQFLGTVNDNMFRWFVIPLGKEVMLNPAQALALGAICFFLPYLVLAPFAGFLADRFSKRSVIVGCKVAELVLMLLGILCVFFGSATSLFIIVTLTGAQAALFSPAKYGSIAEIVSSDRLTKGNGWMGMVTIVATAVGVIGGNGLYATLRSQIPSGAVLSAHIRFDDVALPTGAFLGVAALGLIASLMIRRLPVANTRRQFPWNPVADTVQSLSMLKRDRALLRTALGIAFFWSLASLANLNIDSYGTIDLSLSQEKIGPLLAVLVVGVGLGSLLAGLWSGSTVELGVVPLGGAGICASAFLLYLTGGSFHALATEGHAVSVQHAFVMSCVWLFFLGVSSGLFDIPLEAYLQERSDVRVRGTILAASNFISFACMSASAGLFWAMQTYLGWSASTIFLAAGLGTVPVLIYVVCLIPQATIRCIVWILSKIFYRVRVRGLKNLPERGGALLVANHVSWLDAILLLLVSSRPIRMLAWSDYVTGWWINWLARMWGVIPIRNTDGPKALVHSLHVAREALEQGELVCIFAEGGITRTGQLQPFQRGLLRIVEGTGCPVVPVYLDELWGSIFSFSGGRFFWKLPRRLPYPVSIVFGKPLADPDDVDQVRQAVQNLGVESVEARKDRILVPQRQVLRQLKRDRFRFKIADSGGPQSRLTGGKVLAGALCMRHLLKDVLPPDERMVGILLPPSVGGVVVNLGVSLMPRIAVNLNYTLSNKDVNYCIREAGIKHVITSRLFLEKRPFDLDCDVIYAEDLRPRVTGLMKTIAAIAAFVVPAFILERILGVRHLAPDDLMTVIFSSGSTGEPKGVMLTNLNVAVNVAAANQLLRFNRNDVLLGILPFFHSFGYTFPLWLIISGEPASVYHYNPVEARVVGKLCQEYGVTVIAATPTFIKRYLKRCDKEQFRAVNIVITGAEKLPQDLAKEFEAKFGIFPTEGYGTTEMAPLGAVNVPKSRSGTDEGHRPGTVGRAIPNVCAKIVDPDTFADLGTNHEGLLWFKGPNIMAGYLNQPEKTAEVIRDGWYNTGDFAKIDDDGFIQITGRQSRFSKIGGEMVPHIRIEELLTRIVEDPNDEEGEMRIAVTAVPDKDRGERLIVLHKPLLKSPEEILKQLGETDIPNLWLPSADSFIEVPEIPVLGTGKLDLRALKQLALEKAGTQPALK
jgi:acyl-[acyl-carrier-protein]-phospholipid O-acyltransferase / long-chain-fatty-acid--[acyl-carrier-protein] ligase